MLTLLRKIQATPRRYKVLVLIIVVAATTYISLIPPTPTDRMHATFIDVNLWREKPITGCGGHFTGYAKEFAVLQFAWIDKRNREFSLSCESQLPKYDFLFGKEGTVLNTWMNNLQTYPYSDISRRKYLVTDAATLVVMRIEAHNLYHTLCEWYNIYLLSKLLNFEASKVDIIFMDDRPHGLMDDTWDVLFGEIKRYRNLSDNVVYKNLIWNVIGYESPANFHELHTLPYIEDFRSFVFRSYGVQDTRKLDCRKLHVTVIWRRDYLSHPERKNEIGGLIHRKFFNEKEILDIFKMHFKDHIVNDVVLESMTMKEQLELISTTDILFGMHGAGMAHVMFLPQHAAVLETFPNYWGFLLHFKAFSRWRGIKYFGWQNTDLKNEYPEFYTRIPPEIIYSYLENLKEYLCPT